MIVNHSLVHGHRAAQAQLRRDTSEFCQRHVTLGRRCQRRRGLIRVVSEIGVPWLQNNMYVYSGRSYQSKLSILRARRPGPAASCCTSPPHSPCSIHWGKALRPPNWTADKGSERSSGRVIGLTRKVLLGQNIFIQMPSRSNRCPVDKLIRILTRIWLA